jgi:hypothetical protein
MIEFKIGQYVVYRPANPFKIGGRYVVTRLVPQPNGEPRYIIRSEDDPSCEYTAEASELRTVPGGQ